MPILWVEDEQHIVELDELSERWQVDTALACDLAIARLTRNQYDLIIADLILPITLGETKLVTFEVNYDNAYEDRYKGLWLIRYIRETLQIETPIMVLTIVVGKDREPVERLLDGKIVEYISKYEIMPSDLCDKIEKTIQL